MSAEDWLPWDIDPYGDDERGDRECKQCGVAGLHWEELEPGVWRLFDEDGRRHTCNENRLHRIAAADFEDLDG